MRFTRLSKLLFAVAACVSLTASSAGAHTGHSTSFTMSDSSAGAYSAITTTFEFGSYEPDDMTLDFGPGWRLAHASGHNSEVTPPRRTASM